MVLVGRLGGRKATRQTGRQAVESSVEAAAEYAREHARALAVAAEAQAISRIEQEATAAAIKVAALPNAQGQSKLDDKKPKFTRDAYYRQLKANLAKRAEETKFAEAAVALARELEEELATAAAMAAAEAEALEEQQASMRAARRRKEEEAAAKERAVVEKAEKAAAAAAAAVEAKAEAKVRAAAVKRIKQAASEEAAAAARAAEEERRRAAAVDKEEATVKRAADAAERRRVAALVAAERAELAMLMSEAKADDMAAFRGKAGVAEKARVEAKALQEAAREAAAHLKEAKLAEEEARRELLVEEQRRQAEEERQRIFLEAAHHAVGLGVGGGGGRGGSGGASLGGSGGGSLGGSASFATKISRLRLRRASSRRHSAYSSDPDQMAGEMFSNLEEGEGEYEVVEDRRGRALRALRQAQLELAQKEAQARARAKVALLDREQLHVALGKAGCALLADELAWEAFHAWSEVQEPMPGMNLCTFDPEQDTDVWVDYYETWCLLHCPQPPKPTATFETINRGRIAEGGCR